MNVVAIPAQRDAVANLESFAGVTEWPAHDNLEAWIELDAVFDGFAKVHRFDHFA